LSLIRRVPLSAALFFALFAATIVTSVLVVRARTPDLVLEVTQPKKLRFGEVTLTGSDVRITFFVREADDHARVAIVDSHEDIVRTLDDDADLADGERVTYVWDRATDDGGEAAPGRYRLLVELPSEDRTMIWPRRIGLAPQIGESG
jgi:hypothetical protein